MSSRSNSAPWRKPLWFALTACLAASTAQAAGKAVNFRADDGRTINALAFEPSQRPSPAVVLVPMLGRPKDDWNAIGQRLADAGILAVAIDLPGLSDPGDSKVIGGWSADVHAAVAYLAARPDVRLGSIGVVGASLGASLAALAAAADPAVRALVLVSPSAEYRGVRIDGAMKEYGGRAALLMASNQDPYAARTVRDLAKDPPGPRETKFSEAPAHGTILLARDPEMARALVEWLQATLPR